MSWLSKLGDWFEDKADYIWDKLKWHAKEAWGIVKSFLKDYIEDPATRDRFIAFITKTVIDLQTSDLTGDERKKLAYDKIKAYAEAEGIKLRGRMINWAIENVLMDIDTNGDD